MNEVGLGWVSLGLFNIDLTLFQHKLNIRGVI